MKDKKSDTNQSGLKRNKKGQIIGGKPPAGFNVHPENRSDGRWKKENSFSYQYNRFLNMTIAEFETWNKETKKKERSIAEDLASKRIMASKESLPDVKEITDRTEGKAKQTIEADIKGGIDVADPKTLTSLLKIARIVNAKNTTDDTAPTEQG